MSRHHSNRRRKHIECQYPQCKITFGRRADLIRHEKEIHNSVKMFCQYKGCNFRGTVRWSVLERHCRREHTVQVSNVVRESVSLSAPFTIVQPLYDPNPPPCTPTINGLDQISTDPLNPSMRSFPDYPEGWCYPSISGNQGLDLDNWSWQWSFSNTSLETAAAFQCEIDISQSPMISVEACFPAFPEGGMLDTASFIDSGLGHTLASDSYQGNQSLAADASCQRYNMPPYGSVDTVSPWPSI